MSLLKTLPLLLTVALSVNAAAQENLKRHSVGVQGSIAKAEFKNSGSGGNDVAQIYFHYNYALDQMFSLELGLNAAQEYDDWQCDRDDDDKWLCKEKDLSLFDLDADKLEVNNVVLAGKAQYQLSQRNSLYGKLGVQFYDYKIKQRSTVLVDESGVGLYAEAGWQYRWDNGIGIDAGLKLIKMGDLSIAGTTLGISYAF